MSAESENRIRSARSGRALAFWVLAAVLPATIDAFDANGGWAGQTIEMKLLLDTSTGKPTIPGGTLIDGVTSWNAAVSPTFAMWNAHMARTQFTFSIEDGTAGTRRNGRNEVFFSETVYGEPFGATTLAVAASTRGGTFGLRIVECDVVFNTAVAWNSYRGALRAATDIQRVALHEFGHVLGLDHPNQATPPQSVSAVMNSRVSAVHLLQEDDIAGAVHIYGGSTVRPTITNRLPDLTLVEAGASGGFSLLVDGGPPPPQTDLLQYAWYLEPPGSSTVEILFTINEGNALLGAPQLDDAGRYWVSLETPLGESVSNAATVTVAPVVRSATTRLANLSTRGLVGAGDRAMIVGFVLTGSETRRVLVRAAAPTLATPEYGLAGTIADPVLELRRRSDGIEGEVLVASNDDWHTATDAAAIASATELVGAFPLAPGLGDAAVLVDLAPGSYTAVVTSKGDAEGLAVVEAYDVDGNDGRDSRLSNLSTRGAVGADDGILIAGFVVSGPTPRRYLFRAAGDTLGDFGIAGFLDDPTLALYDGAGTILRKADDWDSPRFLQPKLTAAFLEVGAFEFVDRQETAVLLTLAPGAYTLHLAGFEGSTGIAIAEIYEMPE
jgi:hypothetical protein